MLTITIGRTHGFSLLFFSLFRSVYRQYNFNGLHTKKKNGQQKVAEIIKIQDEMGYKHMLYMHSTKHFICLGQKRRTEKKIYEKRRRR